jgi:hypothetical protein
MRTVKEQVLQAAVRSQPLRDAVDKTAEQLLAETANVRAAQSLLMQLQVSFIFPWYHMTEYLINLIILLNDYFSLQDSLQARRVERSARTKAVGDLRTELRGAEVESESLQLQLRRDRQKMGGMIERSNELEQSIGAANGTNAGLAQLGAEMAVRGAGAILFSFS